MGEKCLASEGEALLDTRLNLDGLSNQQLGPKAVVPNKAKA